MEMIEVTSKEKRSRRKKASPDFISIPERTIEWFGGVNYDNLRRIFSDIKRLVIENSEKEIHLVVSSHGGPTGIGMSFYDAMKSWFAPNLVTIGSGDVDSSGITILLAGKKRFLTKNTTLLLHLAGRTFDEDSRLSTTELEQMLRENRLKDYQYACMVSEATHGKHTPEFIIELMSANTILSAEEAVRMGIAHGII